MPSIPEFPLSESPLLPSPFGLNTTDDSIPDPKDTFPLKLGGGSPANTQTNSHETSKGHIGTPPPPPTLLLPDSKFPLLDTSNDPPPTVKLEFSGLLDSRRPTNKLGAGGETPIMAPPAAAAAAAKKLEPPDPLPDPPPPTFGIATEVVAEAAKTFTGTEIAGVPEVADAGPPEEEEEEEGE
jgi:hypothetical protein